MPEARLPLHLQVTDLFGIRISQGPAFEEFEVLRAVYGLCQIVCTGLPELQDKGRAEVTVAVLLRDATLALAGSLMIAERRLYEPILRLHRGILEARLIVQKLRAGDSEKLANLLAADRLLARKRGFENQIRAGLRPASDPWLRKHLKDIKDTFRQDPHLQSAKGELKALKAKRLQWHGSANLARLAAELGETSSYELIYSPTSALFVHPGDADVHLVEGAASTVRMRTLVCDDDLKLRTALRSVIADAFQLLKTAIAPWQVGAEVRVAVDQAVPLMIISLDPQHTTAAQLAQLERGSGLPRREWRNALKISFDRQDVRKQSSRTRVRYALALVGSAVLLAVLARVIGWW